MMQKHQSHGSIARQWSLVHILSMSPPSHSLSRHRQESPCRNSACGPEIVTGHDRGLILKADWEYTGAPPQLYKKVAGGREEPFQR